MTSFKKRAFDWVRNGIEEDYSDVNDIAAKNLKSSEIAYYPKALVAAYRKDYDVLEKMYDKCDAAFEEMEKKEMTTSRMKKAQGALSAFQTALSILEESNAMFTAHNKHKTASQAAGVLLLFAAIVKGQQEQVKKLLDEIPKLEKKLKTAKRHVTGAKAQRGLNLAITGVTACLPALKGAQLAYVVIGTAATRLAADQALGPTGPTAGATVKTAAGEFAGAVDLLGKGSAKLASAAGAIDALVSDGKEIAEAKSKLKEAQKNLKDVQKRYKDLVRNTAGSAKTLTKTAYQYEKATKAAGDATAKFRASKQRRIDLRKELAEH